MPLSDATKRRMDRRGFAALVTGWVAVISGLAGTAYASVRTLFPNVLFEPSRRLKIGKPADFNDPSVTFLDAPRLFIIRENNEMRSLSAICTHLGCTVNEAAGGQGFRCPCHGSAFDMYGNVTGGPAPAPLPSFALTRAPDGQIVVDMDRRVNPHARLELRETET